jgi:thiamine-monophosphate kinase
MTVGDLSEAALVARIQQHLPPPPAWMTVGIGDDAAVVEPVRNRLEVLTVDALVETVHFDRAFTPPSAIGHRALAVNLSDLAAMGATPRAALLSLAMPRTLPLADFDGIIEGLATAAARHRIHLAGGNLTATPGPLTIDVAVTGAVKPRRALQRGGARAGDELYLSGTIGAAAAALQMLKAGTPSAIAGRYLYPEPRLRLGSLLATNRAASACIDLSDGLADAVRRIAGASGVGAVIDEAAIPIDADARDWFARSSPDPVAAALTGGDDYELLFAVRPRTRRRLAAAIRHGGVPITRIGVCTADPALLLRSEAGDRPLPPGYSHFR